MTREILYLIGRKINHLLLLLLLLQYMAVTYFHFFVLLV